MQFRLIDRITALTPGASITAVKVLSPSEEYLQDHFPRFPVMPGVMMLEAMFQAGGWLIHKTEDFAHTAVVLKEARNVKYADFVAPGQQLTVTAEIIKQDGRTTTFKAQGMVGGRAAVSARLVLERFNLADRYPQQSAADLYAKRRLREEFELLYSPTTSLESVG
jgi:3-hydroxyacyl-[acyl-carrier-protein] dehydratase